MNESIVLGLWRFDVAVAFLYQDHLLSVECEILSIGYEVVIVDARSCVRRSVRG